MEPINCTAYLQNDRCDVWAPTQGQSIAQMVASQVSGLPPDKVFIHTTYLGCGLGRRAAPDFVAEAVIASKIAGKPVKIVWSREDDIKYDQFRAAVCHRIEAGLDGEGKVVGWFHKLACGSIGKGMGPDAIKDGVDEMSLWGIKGGGPFKCDTAYDIPNFYVEQYLSDLPIPVSPWRSVQNAPNAFGMECFMAADGPSALDTIRRQRPHAVVLDVNMPEMDGYEVLAAIRREGIPIRVLLLTARQQEGDVLRGFALGADDYVVKPFSPMELVARLKRLLSR